MGETGPGTHIFADFCRFSLIFGSLCKSRDLGVADLRRKPQETADFRRKPQKTADFCRNRFLPFAVSLLARSYSLVQNRAPEEGLKNPPPPAQWPAPTPPPTLNSSCAGWMGVSPISRGGSDLPGERGGGGARGVYSEFGGGGGAPRPHLPAKNRAPFSAKIAGLVNEFSGDCRGVN